MKIDITDEEQNLKRFNDSHLNLALRYLRELGIVILENAIPLKLVEEIQNTFFKAIRSGQKMKNGPPREMPYCDPQIIANPFSLQILEAAMGKKIALSFYFCHTVPPGIEHHNTAHRDGNHLFPELPCVLPISAACVDIPLVDFTEENGATRIWPGSHLIIDNPPQDVRFLGERAQHLPSIQMVMPVGALSIRDMRLWHGAASNHTEITRAMLDIGYVRVFPHQQERLHLPKHIKQQLPQEVRKKLKIR